MIVLDCGALIRLIRADDGSDDAARLHGLLEGGGVRIGIPAPVLAEYLVRANEASQGLLDAMTSTFKVQILPFDARAAVVCANLDRSALANGDKKGGNRRDSWQQIKVDRQIVAIAVVHRASTIVSEDRELVQLAGTQQIVALRVADLQIPAERRQRTLVLTGPSPAAP
jgi:predicted nucleic acid-binding protein